MTVGLPCWTLWDAELWTSVDQDLISTHLVHWQQQSLLHLVKQQTVLGILQAAIVSPRKYYQSHLLTTEL